MEPTFTEFLTYIAKSQSFDEHWKPYHSECLPCLIKYQYIFKLETLDEEYAYFIRKFNLNELMKNKSNGLMIDPFSILERRKSKGVNKWNERKYYSQVPKKLLYNIYKIYEADFKLFNYSPKLYFHMAIN